ncbi:MAG TPA: cytochrome c biogenesis protein CcdA, partial [Chloroflexaceae bacterium]|nr:cytochrome c biogenesis protein CcdA [Chloroflexaceae bacterium]
MHSPAPRLPLGPEGLGDHGARRWGPPLAGSLAPLVLLGALIRGLTPATPEAQAPLPAAIDRFLCLIAPTAAGELDPETAAALTPDQIDAMLLRKGTGPGGVGVELLYAPGWYFTWSERPLPETEQPALAFFMMELVHREELVGGPPRPLLVADGRAVEALEVRVVSQAPHHRVSQLLFPAYDGVGRPLVGATTPEFSLVMPRQSPGETTLRWALPLEYGLGVINDAPGHQHGTVALPAASSLSGPLVLALLGGMLTALTPCLLQLAAYYTAMLAGTRAGTDERARARRQLLRVGLFFIGGFALVYSLGGLLAGFAGESLQRLGSLETWVRPTSIIAGVVILAMALRVALQAGAPLVCKLPMGRFAQGETGWRGSLVMGVTFAVGCLSCFSATVLSVLLVYAGALGSPLMGAGLLLIFSLGVGLVFVLAAWLATWVTPLMDALYRYRRLSGTLSALVMAFFGVLMITDTFHIVSGYITLFIESF